MRVPVAIGWYRTHGEFMASKVVHQRSPVFDASAHWPSPEAVTRRHLLAAIDMTVLPAGNTIRPLRAPHITRDDEPGKRLLFSGTVRSGTLRGRDRRPAALRGPLDGATGKLLAALGRTAYRPAHLHLKLTHPGQRPLTTQIFFEDDPWLDRDVVVGATKTSLVTRLVRDGATTTGSGSAARIARCRYDFVLEPVPTPLVV